MSDGIEGAAKEHVLSRLMTLTLDLRKCAEGEDLVARIRDVWRKFRVYLKRKHGQPVKYIAVVERQKSGVPHLHVLVDRFIPQKWISSAWSRLGGGRIAHSAGAGCRSGKQVPREVSHQRHVAMGTGSAALHDLEGDQVDAEGGAQGLGACAGVGGVTCHAILHRVFT